MTNGEKTAEGIPVQPPEATQLICIVCGMGSTRSDWKNVFQTSIGKLVACDGHSQAECQAALTRLKATTVGGAQQNKTPAPPAPEKPNGGVKPISVPGAGDTKS